MFVPDTVYKQMDFSLKKGRKEERREGMIEEREKKRKDEQTCQQ